MIPAPLPRQVNTTENRAHTVRGCQKSAKWNLKSIVTKFKENMCFALKPPAGLLSTGLIGRWFHCSPCVFMTWIKFLGFKLECLNILHINTLSRQRLNKLLNAPCNPKHTYFKHIFASVVATRQYCYIILKLWDSCLESVVFYFLPWDTEVIARHLLFELQ